MLAYGSPLLTFFRPTNVPSLVIYICIVCIGGEYLVCIFVHISKCEMHTYFLHSSIATLNTPVSSMTIITTYRNGPCIGVCTVYLLSQFIWVQIKFYPQSQSQPGFQTPERPTPYWWLFYNVTLLSWTLDGVTPSAYFWTKIAYLFRLHLLFLTFTSCQMSFLFNTNVRRDCWDWLFSLFQCSVCEGWGVYCDY